MESTFRYEIIDDAVPEKIISEAIGEIPDRDWNKWVRYSSPHENQKITSRDIHLFGGKTSLLVMYLWSCEWVDKIKASLGIQGSIFPDPTLHGGGIHRTLRGGFLLPHIDYSLHPVLDMERRINLILFLNRQWDDSWGGDLVFYDDEARNEIASIKPRFNRAIIWEPSDISYHGQPEPLNCPEEVSRDSVAIYYMSKKRETTTPRKRALFVPSR